MVFLDKRVGVICDQLEKLSVKQKHPIDGWHYKKGNFLRPKDAEKDKAPFEPFDSEKMHWYGPDKHYWFKTKYTVPQELDGKPLWLYIKTQIEEWDDGKNPQFLLFLNNEIVQGIDMNHREVLIERKATANTVYDLDLQSYTGTLHSEFKLIVEAREIDPEIEALYYDLRVPLNAFTRLPKEGKARRELENVLNNAINILDLRTPYSDDFYSSVKKARDYLKKELYTKLAGENEVIATCIGHTHIDVAWWWTVEQTREKTARSFATVLKLMEEYPEYKFMSSQPQLYDFLKTRYPELYAKLKERVTENRWEPEGGMWVEADTNVTSGESLVRQFMYGKRYFKEEFGVENRILWLPDVFGYTAALPQIMAKCGIDYFMTTKLAWNQFNKIPNDTFLWRGIDGTQVLTHFITTLGVEQSEDNYFTTYNGTLHPDAIIGGWNRYQNKNINNDILISYGYGDGGGGPTRSMLETSKRMEKGIKGIPKVRQAFTRTYFDELAAKVSNSPRLNVWEGELYFEYHRGTLTSMARNKRSNRKAELGLMDLELLSVLANRELPKEEHEKAWKTILINQFHDILPGTSIHEVYEVTKREYEQVKSMIDEHISSLLDEIITMDDVVVEEDLIIPNDIETTCNLAKLDDLLNASNISKNSLNDTSTDDSSDSEKSITIFNTTGFMRSDIVSLGDCKATTIKDPSGTEYPVQQTSEGAIAYIENIPSKGWQTFATTEELQLASSCVEELAQLGQVPQPAANAIKKAQPPSPCFSQKATPPSPCFQSQYFNLFYHEIEPTQKSTTPVPALSPKLQNPFTKKADPPSPCFTLQTPFYTVEFDENGLISRLYDKENQRDVLQNGKKANLMRMYEDKPVYYDNWDIDIFYTEKSWKALQFSSMEWTELGDVRATLEIKREISNSTICQKIRFYAKSRRIDFETEVDWKESQHLLKVHFPLNVHTDEATFDIQFGNLTRKTHANTSWDMARFESCGQKWADLSEGNYGVSLLNDCKYGHSVKDSNIALTLIKSGIEPNPVTDQEIHNFTYSLYPHKGNWRTGETVKQGYFLNQPMLIKEGSPKTKTFSGASSNKENVVIETIKQAEDGKGTIVRLYECNNSLTDATITWGSKLTAVEECNMLEEKITDVYFNNRDISFKIKPYEIKTLRIR